jgi:hypothetical protein
MMGRTLLAAIALAAAPGTFPTAFGADADPAGPAATAAATIAAAPSAAERCESAVADTVRRLRGRDAREVEFMSARRVLLPTGAADETAVKGEGRYRAGRGAATSFAYSCAYDARTGATSGVVLREVDAASARAPAWEPDLTAIAPEACETAAASALKRKYPRVARIAFGSDSRQLSPAERDLTSLEGRGAVQRAPGMHSVPFRYRCEIDTRSGKVVSVQTAD